MSRRRVLMMTLRPPLPPGGGAGGGDVAAFSSDRVAFAAAAGPGVALPFLARISGQDDVIIERQVSAWPLGRSPTQRAGVVTLLNGDRALDSLIGVVTRDWEYDMRWCWDDEAADPNHNWGLCTVWQSGVIDSISTTEGDRRIVLTLADPLARWDAPIQQQMYPDNYPNASVRGKPMPITLGTVRFAPGVLRDTSDLGPDAWSYDLHDGHLAAITSIYDKGDVFTPSDWVPTADRRGYKLTNKPDNPVVATIEGATVVMPGAASTTWDFETGPWSGGLPVGWTVNLGSVQRVAQGARIYNSAGFAAIWESTSVIEAGKRYRAELDVASVSGYAHPRANSFFAFGDARSGADAAGEWAFYSTAQPATRALSIYAGAGPSDATIRKITLTEVQLTDRLPAFVRWISSRMPGTVDTAAIAALDAAAPYQLGTYIDTPITALTLLRRALDAWCGWVTSTRDGRLTVGRIGPRNGAGTVHLGRGQIITVRRSADTASGLATRMAGLRTHKLHSDSDIATSVPGALRAELQAEYVIKEGVTGMPTAYAHAVGADPQPSLLQDAAQLQAAADYVTDIFGQGPFTWYEIDCAISSEIADGLEMGDWIHVTHPVAGLEAGKWLCLLGATIRFYRRRATLVLLDFPEA